MRPANTGKRALAYPTLPPLQAQGLEYFRSLTNQYQWKLISFFPPQPSGVYGCAISLSVAPRRVCSPSLDVLNALSKRRS